MARISVVLSLILMWILSVNCAPKRDNYTVIECYLASECLYRMRSAPDKSICAKYVDICCKRMDEIAYRERLEYCRKHVTECKDANCLSFRECIK